MKLGTIFLVLVASGVGSFAVHANAQDWDAVVEHTTREEAEGKDLWSRFQAKEIACADMTDERFGALGEYFMGQMMGASHAAMNAMMIQTHGEDGEEQIHIVMGKRLSGCDTSAVASGLSGGWTPMMSMMFPLRQGSGGQAGGWSSPVGSYQSNNPMMNFGFTPFGGFGWLFMILWWALIIAGIVAIITWLTGQSRGGARTASPLEILKERYAKGEISKKEFEERKKDVR